jgi:hypothetical protein
VVDDTTLMLNNYTRTGKYVRSKERGKEGKREREANGGRK